ncbi:hypothetical protein C7999DRAFT_10963, partial [Corynascus novoguineensis]
VDYARLPPEDFRIRVLKNIQEVNLFIWWYAAVRHDNLAPRNVMVKPDGSVVIIDFNNVNICDFTPKYDMHPHTRKQNPRPFPQSIINGSSLILGGTKPPTHGYTGYPKGGL